LSMAPQLLQDRCCSTFSTLGIDIALAVRCDMHVTLYKMYVHLYIRQGQH
jgi:hypothetical protein